MLCVLRNRVLLLVFWWLYMVLVWLVGCCLVCCFINWIVVFFMCWLVCCWCWWCFGWVNWCVLWKWGVKYYDCCWFVVGCDFVGGFVCLVDICFVWLLWFVGVCFDVGVWCWFVCCMGWLLVSWCWCFCWFFFVVWCLFVLEVWVWFVILDWFVVWFVGVVGNCCVVFVFGCVVVGVEWFLCGWCVWFWIGWF